MNMHISEFARMTNVSVRTLHYYDEIGLLKPSFVDERNSYRFYDEHCLERMQEILFYRELDFSLKEISMILSSPNYDKLTALKKQKHLLTLKKERLEQLIMALDAVMKGEELSMNVFDNSEFEKQREEYAKEAKERWGDTDAYKESVKKTSDYTTKKWNEVNSAMEGIVAEFAKCRKNGSAPDSTEAQIIVKKWQDFITKTTIPVQMKFLLDLVKCMLLMNALSQILTGMVKAQHNLFVMP